MLSLQHQAVINIVSHSQKGLVTLYNYHMGKIHKFWVALIGNGKPKKMCIIKFVDKKSMVRNVKVNNIKWSGYTKPWSPMLTNFDTHIHYFIAFSSWNFDGNSKTILC